MSESNKIPRSRGKHKVDLLRNLRIVWMVNNRGMTYQEVADHLNREQGGKEDPLSRQRCAVIYTAYKNVPFVYEDDKIIIH